MLSPRLGGWFCGVFAPWQLRASRLRLLVGCSVPTTAQALRPVADRLVDSPLRNGAAGGGPGGYRALAHHNHHNHHHHGGGGGDGDADLGRLDDIADDDEADFTDTDALLEYLLRDRHVLTPTLSGILFSSFLKRNMFSTGSPRRPRKMCYQSRKI
jgi:hypothetical protein